METFDVPIFYSLAVSCGVLRSAGERRSIRDRLRGLPVDSLWVKVSQSGPLTHTMVGNVVNGAADLHALEGAVRRRIVDAAVGLGRPGIRLAAPELRSAAGHAPETRGGQGVLRGARREVALRVPGAGMLHEGLEDMLDNPVRHALVQRSEEIQRLTDAPRHLRAQRFLEETLRPARG